MTASINAADSDYIGEARGSDCEVEIVINVPDNVLTTLEGPAVGIYQEPWDRILVRAGTTKPTVVHEGENFTTKPESMSSDMHAGVAHAIYSISQEVGDDMAFKIVLGTDLEEPNSLNAYQVISEVAGDLGVGTEVDEVLDGLALGRWQRN